MTFGCQPGDSITIKIGMAEIQCTVDKVTPYDEFRSLYSVLTVFQTWWARQDTPYAKQVRLGFTSWGFLVGQISTVNQVRINLLRTLPLLPSSQINGSW